MSEVVSVEEDDGGSRGLGLYPIRTVSRLTGVPPVTLRAWERRYRLLTPTRTEKGHRLYTEADIERVRQVLALMDRGVGVGQVGPFLARAANDGDLGRVESGVSLPGSIAPASPTLADPQTLVGEPRFPSVHGRAIDEDPTRGTAHGPARAAVTADSEIPASPGAKAEVTERVPMAMFDSPGIDIRHSQRALQTVPTAGFDPWPGYIAAMLAGVARFDTAALDAVYNDALSLYPIERVASHLTTPVLERLGAAWPQGEASIAREHFFSNFLRNKLGARFQHLNALGQGPRLVAACPAGEHHELGLIQFALAAAGQGYRLVLLGADVPAPEIAAAARIADCRAVVLSASARMPAEALARELAALGALTSLPILVGGLAAVHSPQVITAAGARPLGTDFTTALRLIGACLGWPQAADAGPLT